MALTPHEVARAEQESIFRNHILLTAERLVSERGISGTRMQDLAAEAHVALATIYRFFPTKKSVVDRLVSLRTAELYEHARNAIDPEACRLEQIVQFELGFIDYYIDRPVTLRFILVATPSAWGLIDDNEEWNAYRDFTIGLLTAGIEAGAVEARDPGLTARLLGSIVQVNLSSWIVNGQTETRATVLAEVRDQVVRAIAPSGGRALRGCGAASTS